jgi:hypothetical protein
MSVSGAIKAGCCGVAERPVALILACDHAGEMQTWNVRIEELLARRKQKRSP